MASYRVFRFSDPLPQAVASGHDIAIIRDGFSTFALIFPVLWLLWYRLWFGFLAYLAVLTAFVASSEWMILVIGGLLNSLFGLYLGIDGANWRAWKFLKNGWQEIDVVIAGDMEEAEMRVFSISEPDVIPPSNQEHQNTASPQRPLPPGRRSPGRAVIGGLQPRSPGIRP